MSDGGGAFDSVSGFVAQLQALLPFAVDNGDGTITPQGQYTDNGDGTITYPDTTTLAMFDNGDGTIMSLAAMLQNFRTAFGTSYSGTLTQSVTDQVWQAVKGGLSVNNPLTSIKPSLQGIPGGNVVGTAFDADGTGEQGGTNTTVIAWPHTIGALANYAVAGVTGYYSGTGFSNWTRHVSVSNNPVTFDAVGGGVANGAHGTTAQTWSHTISSAPNTVVIVATNQIQSSGTINVPTAVSFGGQSMTPLFSGQYDDGITTAGGLVILYILLNPTNRGTQTVSVTGASTTTSFWANSVSYTNVSGFGIGSDLGGVFLSDGSSTNPSTTVKSGPGHMVVSIVGAANVAVSSPTGTSRYSQSGTSSINSGYLMEQAGAYPTVTVGCSAATAQWATTSIDLVPVGTAMTSLGVANCDNTTPFGWVEMFGLANPPTGACSVNIYEYLTSAPGSTGCYLGGNSVSYSGVGSAAAAVTNFGAATTVTTGAVPSASGHVVVAALAAYDETLSAPSGTVRYGPSPATATTNVVTLYITDAAGAATVAQTCTVGSSPKWATVAVDLA